MKKKIMVIVCSLLLTMPGLSFAKNKRELNPSVSVYEYANEDVKLKRGEGVLNNKVNKRIKGKRTTKKEAADAKAKVEKAQDNGTGQVKVKF